MHTLVISLLYILLFFKGAFTKLVQKFDMNYIDSLTDHSIKINH